MFASKVTSQVVFPDGVVNIRKLSAMSLEKAQAARQITVSQLSRSMGPELIRAFNSPEVEEAAKNRPKPTPEEKHKARYAGYDRQLVLQAGVVSWTYQKDDGTPLKVSEGLADVDEESAEKLHEAILDLSLPPITEAEQEAVQAKD